MSKPYQSIPDTVKDFSNQTVALKADLYDEFKNDSGVVWVPLPGMVFTPDYFSSTVHELHGYEP